MATITPREGCDVPTDDLMAPAEDAGTPEEGAEMVGSATTKASETDGSTSGKTATDGSNAESAVTASAVAVGV